MENEVAYEQSIFEEEQFPVYYAGFWVRFGALILDGLILLPLSIVNYYNQTSWKSIGVMVIAGLAALIYKPLLEYLHGATPGKKALQLAITNTAHEKPNLKQALLRNIFGVVAGVISLGASAIVFSSAQFKEVTSFTEYNALYSAMGYAVFITGATGIIYIVDAVVLLANKDKRSLHDFIGSTYVIKK